MKTRVSILALTALLAAGTIGCSPSDSTGGSGGTTESGSIAGFDLSKLEGAFASANDAVKAQFHAITDYVKGGNYSTALEKIQTLASSAELSTDQKNGLNELIAQLKSTGGDILTGAGETAIKAVAQAKEVAGQAAARASDAATKAATQASDAAKKATDGLLPK